MAGVDRFTSTASLSIGPSTTNREADVRQSQRSHPSPSFYRNGAQPIHPVLQRRNTPLRLGRRVTQPVPVSFPSPDPSRRDENENLSCDKTGRLPIPPPRGPRYRAPVARNVSQCGLRSPKLSPKPPRARGVDVSPGTRYQNTVELDSWDELRARKLLADYKHYPSPATKEVNVDRDSRVQRSANRPIGSNGIYGTPRRSKFYIEIPSKDTSPPSTPPAEVKAGGSGSGRHAVAPARIRKVLMPTPPINYTPHHQHHQRDESEKPTFDEIVDEIFKTIGSRDLDGYANHTNYRRRQQQLVAGEVLLRNHRIGGVDVLGGQLEDGRLNDQPEILQAVERINPHNKTSIARTSVKEPSRSSAYQAPVDCTPPQPPPPLPPLIHRSQSDVSRDKSRFKRRLVSAVIPSSTTVPEDLCMHGLEAPRTREWMEESTTEVHHPHYSSEENVPERNVMQRMRRGLTNLRSGMMARLTKTPQYAGRKSSYECDVAEEPSEVPDQCVFYDIGREEGLLKPVRPTPHLGRIRKPTSADSGIMDIGQEGDDLSSSSRRAPRPTSSDYSSDSPMRRSRSQPPNRQVSFTGMTTAAAAAAADDKSSDLDRSVSARSSRTSQVSDSSASPGATGGSPSSSQDAMPPSPLYIESLWSQVKYEVDCHQHISECSPEGMRANIVKEIVQNERDFVNNLKDVIEGYLYKCRQRSDMFSKGRIECIFTNVEQLYEFQCEFLADLESSVISNNIHRSEIGHCFLLHQRGFSDLYSDYCNLHTQSATELQQLKQIKQYAHFFEACRMLQEMVEISLDGFLLQPVQKICKYPLQLTELLKYTPEDHPDCQSVKLALKAMKGVTGMINERKRRLECLEKIALWQETIDSWEGDDLVEQSSQLIHYGDLNKLSSKNSWTHEYTFFLFDHQLIYCRRDILKRTMYTYKGRFDLDEVDMVDLDQNDAGIKHGWVMVCPDKELSTILLAKSAEEKSRWMDAFKDERRRVKTDISHAFFIAPKDRLAAIQTAKMLTAGKEKRSKTKDALKDLTEHTHLDQSMRSKSMSMTLPVRIRAGQASRNPFVNKMPLLSNLKKA